MTFFFVYINMIKNYSFLNCKHQPCIVMEKNTFDQYTFCFLHIVGIFEDISMYIHEGYQSLDFLKCLFIYLLSEKYWAYLIYTGNYPLLLDFSRRYLWNQYNFFFFYTW